jgi:hypothetical protein
MRDPSAPAKRRDEMAKAAAPFLHSKLASIENPKIQEGSRLDGKRVNPGFDIGEVLQKKRSHIGVDLIAIRDRQIGPRTTPRFLTFLPTRGLGEPAQGEAVPNIPRNARQLASTIG